MLEYILGFWPSPQVCFDVVEGGASAWWLEQSPETGEEAEVLRQPRVGASCLGGRALTRAARKMLGLLAPGGGRVL